MIAAALAVIGGRRRPQCSGCRPSRPAPSRTAWRREQLHVRERDQARDPDPVRQHAFPAGPRERPVGPRADAAPAELHPRQRHAAHERPHGPDLAHRDRDPLDADRRLSRSAWGSRCRTASATSSPTAHPHRRGSFAYWTAPLFDPAGPVRRRQTDLTPEMINENGKIAPAPWVPFTRAGCDVGEVAHREHGAREHGASTSRPSSAPARPRQARSPPTARRTARRRSPTSSASASTAPRDRRSAARRRTPSADLLPDEPGGYAGFKGLFGAKYVNPVIKPGGPMTDLDGNRSRTQTGHVGFPGFDGMDATDSLS